MIDMEVKKIIGKEGYYIGEDGTVFKAMKPWHTSKGYLDIKLNGQHCGVHRLVGKHFIPNEQGKLEINHKDGNKDNNRYSNLEWMTRKENINHMYDELGYTPVRNNTECFLYKQEQCLGYFNTVKSACEHANQYYNVPLPSLSKNRYWKDFKIVKKV